MTEGLGLWLRRAREARQLSLEDIEKELRIRRRYLQALELGDYSALPGQIQARGFLRNYARFLGVPVEEALARYEAEVEGRPLQPRARPIPEEKRNPDVTRPSVFPSPPSEEEETRPASTMPRTLIPIFLGLMGVFLLIAVGAFVYLQFMGTDPQVTARTPTPGQPTAVAPVVPTQQILTGGDFVPALDGKVTLRLDPTQHVWVRVVADDAVVFQGIAAPGQPLEASAATQVQVETGNGGAFTLTINGVDWGTLGNNGQVVRRAWSPQGEIALQVP